MAAHVSTFFLKFFRKNLHSAIMANHLDTPFQTWRKRIRLSREEAAAALGRSRRQIFTYEAGGEIPRIVKLAMGYLEDHPGERSGDG